jgi:hypothetical protein
MLADFGSSQSSPTYAGGKLTETAWRYENWTVGYHLCKCVVQSAL